MRERLPRTAIASRTSRSAWLATIVALIAVGTASVAVAGVAGSDAPPKVQRGLSWVMQDNSPSTNYVGKALTNFANNLKKQSKGKINLTINWLNTLGFSPTDMVSLTENGSVDVGNLIGAYVGPVLPESAAPELPGIVPYNLPFRVRLTKDLKPYLQAALADKNQIVLALSFGDTRGLISSKPLRTLADLKGLKVRASGAAEGELSRSLGMVPVSGITSGQSYTALQSGLVEAVWTSIATMYDLKMYEVAKNVLNMKLSGPGFFVYTVNADSYADLTAANRTLLAKLGEQIGADIIKYADQEVGSAVGNLKAQGVTVNDLSPADKTALNSMTIPIVNKFGASNGSRVQKMISIIRKDAKLFGIR